MSVFEFDLYDAEMDDEMDVKIKNILKTALQSRLAGGSDVYAGQISKCCVEQLNKHENTNASGIFGGLEDIFIHVATILPHDSQAQDDLVKIIDAMHRTPAVRVRGKPWSVQSVVAGHLPGLLHEALEGGQNIGIGMNEPENEVSRKRWRNYNSFEARITGQGVCDCHEHGGYALRDALEHWKIYRAPFDLRLAVALDWSARALPQIFRPEQFSEEDSTRYPFKFSRAGWEGWAGKLKGLGEDGTLDSEVRNRCSREAMRMFDLLAKDA